MYRRNCQQAKIYTFDPAAVEKKKAAAAAGNEKSKTEATDAEKNKAATTTTADMFCHIAAADTVARAAARAAATTDIQSVVRAGQRHQFYDKLQRREATFREEKATKVGRLEAARETARLDKAKALKAVKDPEAAKEYAPASVRRARAVYERVEPAAAQLDVADKECQRIIEELRYLEAWKEDDAATILWDIRQRILRNS